MKLLIWKPPRVVQLILGDPGAVSRGRKTKVGEEKSRAKRGACGEREFWFQNFMTSHENHQYPLPLPPPKPLRTFSPVSSYRGFWSLFSSYSTIKRFLVFHKTPSRETRQKNNPCWYCGAFANLLWICMPSRKNVIILLWRLVDNVKILVKPKREVNILD